MNDNDNELRLSTGLNIQNLCGPVKDTKGNLIFEGISPLVMALYIMFKHTESVNNGIPFIKLINVPNLDEIYELSDNTIFSGKAAIIQCVENRILNVLKKALTKNSSDTNKDIIIKLEKTIQSMFGALKLHTSNNMFTDTSGTIKSLLLILSALGSEEYNSIQNINDLSKVDIKIKRAAQYFFSKINISIFNDDKTKNAYLYKEFQKLYNKTEVKSEELQAFDILTIDPTMIIKGITNFIKFIDIYSNSNALLNELDSSKISTASYSTPAPKGSPQKLTDSDNSDNGSVLDYSEYIKLNLKQEINDLFSSDRYKIVFKLVTLLRKEPTNDEQLNTFYDQELELIKKMFAIDSEDKASLNLIHNLVLERIDAAEESILTKELVSNFINSNTHNDELLLKLLSENLENLENPSFNSIKQQEINKQFIELKQENSLERFINTQQEFITDVSKLNFGEYNKLQKELLNNDNYLDNKLAIDEIQKQKAIKDSSQERRIIKYSDKDALPLMSEVPQNNESDQHSSRNELNESIHNTPNRGEGEEGNRESENSSPRSETDKSENVTPNIPAANKPQGKTIKFGNGSKTEINDDEIHISNINTIRKFATKREGFNVTPNYEFLNVTHVKQPIIKMDTVLTEFTTLMEATTQNDFIFQAEDVAIDTNLNTDAIQFLNNNKPDSVNEQFKGIDDNYYIYYEQLAEIELSENQIQNIERLQNDVMNSDVQLPGLIQQYLQLLQEQIALVNKSTYLLTEEDIQTINNNNSQLGQLKNSIDTFKQTKNESAQALADIRNKYARIRETAEEDANKLAKTLINKKSTEIISNETVQQNISDIKIIEGLELNAGQNDNLFVQNLYWFNNGLKANLNNAHAQFVHNYDRCNNYECNGYREYGICEEELDNLFNTLTNYPNNRQEQIENSFRNLHQSFVANIENLREHANQFIQDENNRNVYLEHIDNYSHILEANENIISFNYNDDEGTNITGRSNLCTFNEFHNLIIELARKHNELTNELININAEAAEIEIMHRALLIDNIEDADFKKSDNNFNTAAHESLNNDIDKLNKNMNLLLQDQSMDNDLRNQLLTLQESLISDTNQNCLKKNVGTLLNDSQNIVNAYDDEYNTAHDRLLEIQQLNLNLTLNDILDRNMEAMGLVQNTNNSTIEYDTDVMFQNIQLQDFRNDYNSILGQFNSLANKQEIQNNHINALQQEIKAYPGLIGGNTNATIQAQQKSISDTVNNLISTEPSVLKRITLMKAEALRQAQETAQNKLFEDLITSFNEANDEQQLKEFLKNNEIGVGCNHTFEVSSLEICNNINNIEAKHNLVRINGTYYAVLRNIDVTNNNNVIKEGSFTLIDLKIQTEPNIEDIESMLFNVIVDLRTKGIGKNTNSYLFDNLEELKQITPNEHLYNSYQKQQVQSYIIGEKSKQIYDNTLEEILHGYNNQVGNEFNNISHSEEFNNDAKFTDNDINLFKTNEPDYVLPIKTVLQQNECLVPVKVADAFKSDVNNYFHELKFTPQNINNGLKLEINEHYQALTKDNINNFSINSEHLAEKFLEQKQTSLTNAAQLAQELVNLQQVANQMLVIPEPPVIQPIDEAIHHFVANEQNRILEE